MTFDPSPGQRDVDQARGRVLGDSCLEYEANSLARAHQSRITAEVKMKGQRNHSHGWIKSMT